MGNVDIKSSNTIDINREGIKWKMNDKLTYLYYGRIEEGYGGGKDGMWINL